MALVAAGDLNSPSSASLLLGTRGMGKTALLQALDEQFDAAGWYTLSVTANPAGGLLEDLASQAAALHHRILHGPDPRGRIRAASLGAFGVSVGVERGEAPEAPSDLRQTLARLGEAARQAAAGLLVTVDELQDAAAGEIREFAAIFQHESSRSRLPIVFVGAGLLEVRATLLAGRHSTFLHRCEQYEVGLLGAEDSRRALSEPITTAGGVIGDEALEVLTVAAGGHPYMLQLVGYEAWAAAADPQSQISTDEARRGLETARRDMGARIFAPVWRDLSDVDKRLLVAMLHDPERSHVGELARRWGGPPRQVGSYRQRLILRGAIRAAGRGLVAFAHPEARRYVALQSAEEGWSITASGEPVDPTELGPPIDI